MFNSLIIIAKVELLLLFGGLIASALLRAPDRAWVRRRLLPVPMGLFALGMLAPNVWVLFGLLVIGLPLLARTRGEGAALFLMMMVSLPDLEVPLVIGGNYLVRLNTIRVLAIGLLIVMAVRSGGERRVRRFTDVPTIALVVLIFFSDLRGLHISPFVRSGITDLFSFLVPVLVVSRSSAREEDLRRLILTFCFCGMLMSFVAVYQAAANYAFYQSIYGHLRLDLPGLRWFMKMRGGHLRAPGPFLESTSFAWFLAMTFVATLALKDAFVGRVHYLAGSAIVGVGLLATQARGGWMAAIIGMVAVSLYRRRYATLVTKLVLVGLAGALLVLASHSSAQLRESLGMGGSSESTVDYRKQLFHRGTEEIRHDPVLGTDIGGAYARLADLRQGEGIVDFVNGYILFGMTGGLIGITLLLFAMFSAAGTMLNRRVRDSRDPRILAAGSFVFAISMSQVLSVFTSGFSGQAMVYYLLVLAVGSSAAALRRQDPAAAAAEAPV